MSSGTDMQPLRLLVNGRIEELMVESRRTLAEVLREDLGLTGTHLGCEHGVCGACTVAVGGEPARSCLMLAVQAEGAEVETVESLASDGALGPLQEAMWAHHAFQCAFCAPGFLMTMHCLLAKGNRLSVEEIKAELSGNLCRCTGYASILEGAAAAAALVADGSNADREPSDA